MFIFIRSLFFIVSIIA